MEIDLCSIRTILADLKDIEEKVKNETDLSLNEALCLCQHYKGKNDPSSLSKEMVLSPSRMTRILDSLSSKGFIERIPSEEDRRSVTIKVTGRGKKMTQTLHSLTIDIPSYLIHAIQQLETATGDNS